MKIRIAICTNDKTYSERIVRYFNAHYYDKFSFNVYTDLQYLLEGFDSYENDILLIGDELEEFINEDFSAKIGGCLFAWLAESRDEELNNGQFVIKKYCRADKIYRDLLEIYSNKSNLRYKSSTLINEKTELYAFIAPAGGVGTSTVALAVAQKFAKSENVLYLSLENFGGHQLVFSDNEGKGFDEIIFALKSRRKALELKLESVVSRDKSGVYFFKDCDNAMEMNELTEQDVREFLSGIQKIKTYDKVIIDIGNGMQERDIAVLSMVNRLVIVTDGSEVAERKLERYINTLRILEKAKKIDICSKMVILMNKTNKNITLPEQVFQVRVRGSLPQMENGTYSGIIDRLAGMEVLQNIR